MAVIYRKTLTGQAKDIKDTAIKKAATYNPNIVALNQQRNILGAQSSSLVANTNYSLNQVSKNIYQAQRQKAAESAMLGLTGAIAQVRDTVNLQTNIANELGSIINEAEQGAMNIAGQQSALNEAEVQYAATEILDTYADQLIKEGNSAVSRDWGRQIANGFMGAFTGALAGLGIGALGTKGIKTVANPTSGKFAKIIAGTGLGVAAGAGIKYGSNLIKDFQSDGSTKQNKNRKEEWWENPFWYGAAGSGIGIGSAFLNTTAEKLVKVASKSGPTGFVMSNAVETLGSKIASSNLLNNSTKLLNGGGKFKFALKSNPWVLGASALIGGVIGGISAGWKPKYKLDLNNLMTQETAQQFSDFGLDLTPLSDIIYNM